MEWCNKSLQNKAVSRILLWSETQKRKFRLIRVALWVVGKGKTAK